MSFYTMHKCGDSSKEYVGRPIETYRSEDGCLTVQIEARLAQNGLPYPVAWTTYETEEDGLSSCFNATELHLPSDRSKRISTAPDEDTPENRERIVAECAAMYRDGIKYYRSDLVHNHGPVHCKITADCFSDSPYIQKEEGKNMSTITEQINGTQQEAKAKSSWQERFAGLVTSAAGWEAYLKTSAEHPGMSVHNIAAIMQGRIAWGYEDTTELYTMEEANNLGGHVRKGAHPIPLTEAVRGEDGKITFKTVQKFPTEVIGGLDPQRFRGKPFKVNSMVPESLDRFTDACNRANGMDLSDPAAYIIARRYGLVEENTPLPIDKAFLSDNIDEVLAKAESVHKKLADVCGQIDRALKLQKHPEWATERDVKRGLVDSAPTESATQNKVQTPTAEQVLKGATEAKARAEQAGTEDRAKSMKQGVGGR